MEANSPEEAMKKFKSDWVRDVVQIDARNKDRDELVSWLKGEGTPVVLMIYSSEELREIRSSVDIRVNRICPYDRDIEEDGNATVDPKIAEEAAKYNETGFCHFLDTKEESDSGEEA